MKKKKLQKKYPKSKIIFSHLNMIEPESISKNIKLGIHEDSANREKLSDLLMFYSTKSGDNMVTFKEYIENMEEAQKSIYYITGESKKAVENSPFIEKCKKRNYEVLYLTDPIDEYMVQSAREYEGKKLVDVSKEGIKFDEEEIKDAINDAVYNFESRVLLHDIKVVLSPDENDIRITIKFQVISTEETDTLNVSLTRLR